MIILVTGATGFIGAALCRALVGRGDHVVAFHRYSSSLRGIEDLPIQRAIGDLTDEASIRNAMQHYPDAVVHLAARQLSARSLDPLYAVNVTGSRVVFQEAFRAGVRRVVLVSSAATIGPSPAHSPRGKIIPITESGGAALVPEDEPFASSKKAAEIEAQWALAYGLDVVTVNPAVVLGPGDRYRRRLNPITRFIENPPRFWFDGGLNYVDVRDVVAGLIGAIEYGEKGKRYLLTGTNLSYFDLYKKLADLTGVPAPALKFSASAVNRYFRLKQRARNIFPVGGTDNDPARLAGQYYYFDNRASRLALKLSPPRSIDETLRDAYEWFQRSDPENRIVESEGGGSGESGA